MFSPAADRPVCRLDEDRKRSLHARHHRRHLPGAIPRPACPGAPQAASPRTGTGIGDTGAVIEGRPLRLRDLLRDPDDVEDTDAAALPSPDAFVTALDQAYPKGSRPLNFVESREHRLARIVVATAEKARAADPAKVIAALTALTKREDGDRSTPGGSLASSLNGVEGALTALAGGTSVPEGSVARMFDELGQTGGDRLAYRDFLFRLLADRRKSDIASSYGDATR